MMVFPKKEAGVATAAAVAGGGTGPAGFPKIPILPDQRKRAEPDAAAPAGAKADGPGASKTDAAPKPAQAAAESKDAPQKPQAGASDEGPRKPQGPGLDAQPALQRLLTDVRRDLEQTVNKEMKRVEQEFGSIVQALSMQLLEARERAEKYERESTALREANETMEKKVRVLRELQEKLRDV